MSTDRRIRRPSNPAAEFPHVPYSMARQYTQERDDYQAQTRANYCRRRSDPSCQVCAGSGNDKGLACECVGDLPAEFHTATGPIDVTCAES